MLILDILKSRKQKKFKKSLNELDMLKIFFLISCFFLRPVWAANIPSDTEKAKIGTFRYFSEADQEKGSQLNKKYDQQRQEKRKAKSKNKPTVNKN